MNTQTLDQILSLIGALGVLATALGAILPQTWRATAAFKLIGTDIRALLGKGSP